MAEAWALFACGVVLVFAGTDWLARLVGRAAGAAGAGWLVAGPVARAGAGATAVLAASLTAAVRGSPGVALGCVVGGAVAVIGVGLGLAAAGRPLRGELRLLWTQLPVMMGATGLVWFLSGDGNLNRTDGGVLLTGFVIWVWFSARSARGVTRPADDRGHGTVSRTRVLAALVVVAGGALLLAGAGLDLQALLGLTEWTTGLTLVAAGAAAPTLAAVVRAGWRGDSDTALTTVAAANTTILLLVLGVVCVVRPFAIRDPAAFRELPALGLSAVLLVPALLNGLRISRLEGATWVAAYAALVAWQLGALRP
ncbi:MAG TPA: hypothetical protein VH092_17415 [Urbifossiella sp.]|jgi:cation:H+ antiporter|nr:hypothetical protein [Urbifossiella sp.]